MDLNDQNAPIVIFSMCPECPASNIEAVDQISISFYGFDFLSSYLYSGVHFLSCDWLCFMKHALCAFLVILCHQYISRSLACVIYVLVFLDWTSLIQLVVAVVSVNVLLTLIIYQTTDAKVKKIKSLCAIKYFERCVIFSRVLVLLTSVAVGLQWLCLMNRKTM